MFHPKNAALINLQIFSFFSYSYQKVSTSETDVTGVCDLRKFSEKTPTASDWEAESVTDGHRFVIFERNDGKCSLSSQLTEDHHSSPTERLESRTLPGRPINSTNCDFFSILFPDILLI